jgi:HD-GYP domain-containing protein (c-di-GMP phosphodiesterase class II)
MKPFENDNFVQTIKNILNKNIEINNENIPIPDCTLPFPVPQLQQKVNAVMDQIKKNSKLKALFNNLIVNRNSDNFLMEHIGMLINISTGISIKMEWDTDKTLEKFVYASYLHDIALAERPDLARIHATAIELELMKDNMNSRDYQLLFEHPNLAAKTIDSINEIPQDVGTMVKQHHELPRENGYPAKLSFGKITPLSTVFIVSHDLLHYIVKNPKWTMKEYLAGAKIKFKGPHFAKVIYALSEIA